MNRSRIRKAMMHFEFEIDEDTKDMIDDLLTKYPNTEIIVARAIAALHEKHFGAPDKKGSLPTMTSSIEKLDEGSLLKLDELVQFMKETREKESKLALEVAKASASAAAAAAATKQPSIAQLSPEANEQILAKIEELGVKFSKRVSQEDSKQKDGAQKTVTTEMSKEEVLQLLKRIDQLESKLTTAISKSRVASAVGGPRRSSSSSRDMGEPPKIGTIKPIDGAPAPDVDRPLLEDVLNSVIVSVEDEEE